MEYLVKVIFVLYIVISGWEHPDWLLETLVNCLVPSHYLNQCWLTIQFYLTWMNFKSKFDTFQGNDIHIELRAVSIRKTVLPGMAIPMLKIRRPNGRLIFNMEIAIRR